MKRTVWIARTAILLALLVCLQVLTRGFGQLVTGACVNLLLAVAALTGGAWSGVSVALLSPIFAKLLGIGPIWPLVPCVALGNAVYVLIHALLTRKALNKKSYPAAGGWMVLAAGAKFAVLYVVLLKVVAPLVVPKAEMLAKLAGTFGLMQLATALLGGVLALAVVPVLEKAISKKT